MNQVLKLKKLANLGFFDKNTLAQFMELSENSLYANIKRWLKSGVLIQLKNRRCRMSHQIGEYVSVNKLR